MKIPLFNRLKRQAHKKVGTVQDTVVEIVYSLQGEAVLHGGTAIWRCFQGNRFSEDLDFYFAPKKGFAEAFRKTAELQGLELLKFKQTESTIYSKVSSEGTVVALEVALLKFENPIVKAYEKIDGFFIDVFVPSAEDLLLEKLNAFRNRKLVRDIFDVYHLSNFVEENKSFNVKVSELLDSLPLPIDEKNLKSIVLSGAVPDHEQMVSALKRRFSK